MNAPPRFTIERIGAIAIVAALAGGWVLPLSWKSVLAASLALVMTALVSVRRLVREARSMPLDETTAGAVCCLTGIGLTALGYAVFALTHEGAFGSVTRVGYPFLIGTRLYLRGGFELLMLCGVVSILPMLFPRRSRNGPHDRLL